MLPVVLPSRLRAPVKAAASAAFWQSVLAAAIMPTSIANATKTHRPTRLIAKSGRIVPRRRRWELFRNIFFSVLRQRPLRKDRPDAVGSWPHCALQRSRANWLLGTVRDGTALNPKR